jgi:hypothetical protein
VAPMAATRWGTRPMSDSNARALAFNAVGPALAESGDWLPLSVRQRVADAVLAALESAETPPAARRLLEEALHLRMNGERAPGGNETWREWDRRAEMFLRAMSHQGEG